MVMNHYLHTCPDEWILWIRYSNFQILVFTSTILDGSIMFLFQQEYSIMQLSRLVYPALLLVMVVCTIFAEEKSARKKLQIGVKRRVQDCRMKSKKGDTLHMHYTVGIWRKGYILRITEHFSILCHVFEISYNDTETYFDPHKISGYSVMWFENSYDDIETHLDPQDNFIQ